MTEPNRRNGHRVKQSATDATTAPPQSEPLIVLDDRTKGPDSEIHRFKSQLLSVTTEHDRARNENVKLRSEMIEFRHMLANFELKDLRISERVDSWMRAFRL